MIARVDDGAYTMMATLPMEVLHALSADFDEPRYRALLSLLPASVRAQLEEVFRGPFESPETVELPPAAFVVDVRAKLGEPQRSEERRVGKECCR